MAKSTSKATSKLIQGLQVENTVRNFTIRIDEPKNAGGSDTGMTPVEAALVALGSCITITAAAFAKAQNIDLQEFWVELEGDLNLDGFMKGTPGVKRGFEQIRVTPHIKTSSSPEAVEKFLAFVESRCPVTDMLKHETEIVAADAIIEG